jgi:tricorn protease
MPVVLGLVLLLATAPPQPTSSGSVGYYRFPAIHGDTVVFGAEGDLWQVSRNGGVAARLTSHAGDEAYPAISPDGATLAFSAEYDGPSEVYTMPLAGGSPRRRTFEGGGARVVGFARDGAVVYSTRRYSTLPDTQLFRLDLGTGARTAVPLAQAADGDWTADGRTLVFTRLPFQGSHTKRYRGGTAQGLWKYVEGTPEAVPLTADFTGTSKTPMWWGGRVYFLSDRDGTMNVWSMDEDGRDLRQHTRRKGWEADQASLSEGRIAYKLGAELRVLELATGTDQALDIRLSSDFDQERESWVKKPMDYLTSIALSPKGDRIALTARGQVFVAPAKLGRLVEVTRAAGVRYRRATFLPDGKGLVALSDQSGEVELWKLPANGVGQPEQMTRDAKVLRWEAVPSPDGKWVAHHDKDRQLWLWSVEKKTNTLVATSRVGDFEDLAWSPDSGWLAYAVPAPNSFSQVFLYRIAGGTTTAVTTDRFDSGSPAWSPGGDWLYFLSDRNIKTLVRSPWGSRQPDPFLTRPTEIFAVALKKDGRFPFLPPDELHPEEPKKDETKKEEPKEPKKEEPGKEEPQKEAKAGAGKSETSTKTGDKSGSATDKDKDKAEEPPKPVLIDLDGLAARLYKVPVPAGRYRSLQTDGKRLFWLSADESLEPKPRLQAVAIGRDREKPEVKTVMEGVREFQLSADRKKLLVRKEKENDLYVFDAGDKAPEKLDESKVDLSRWMFSFDPREQWRQMFVEAWRLERDYFYDRGMHGLDWPKVREKYEALVPRVRSRGELSDLLAQMVSELSALHIFVRGGDLRKGPDDVEVASLGAELARDEAAGGWRVVRIYAADPDLPQALSPLRRDGAGIGEGDVIESVNGVATLSVGDPATLLRNQAGRQVLLRVKPKTGVARDVIVVPMTVQDAANLRYDDWEYSRRRRVDEQGKGRLGYVHLRAMGGDNYAEWAREYYPVFRRQGLIIDVRHNRGGNIDSWILGKLLRKAWFYWQDRAGDPSWNMQYAFRGHVVVLVDQWTASDGEAFAEGFRRLGLGKVIGVRTWGGEIWLSANNLLVDNGIATAAESGVYGPEGQWLIEGHGVEPDIVVDNLPRATFDGKDEQLDAAIRHLEERLREKPIEDVPPPYPRKAVE